MEIGDTVRLRLHVSKTSNRLEPAACELELVTFYRVDDCDGSGERSRGIMKSCTRASRPSPTCPCESL